MKALLFIFSLLMYGQLCVGQVVDLTWDKSLTPDVNYYKIYYGSASRKYTNSLYQGSQNTTTISNLFMNGKYFLAVTAVNSSGESDYSNELEINYVNTNKPPTISFTVNPIVVAPDIKRVDFMTSIKTNHQFIRGVYLYNIYKPQTGAIYLTNHGTVYLKARLLYNVTNFIDSGILMLKY